MFSARSSIFSNVRDVVLENVCKSNILKENICNKDLEELLGDRTDLFQRNMLDHHVVRLYISFQNGKYATVDSLCFVEPSLENFSEVK